MGHFKGEGVKVKSILLSEGGESRDFEISNKGFEVVT